MGQVWLAEQTEPIHRQVALKLIKVGRYDPSVLQRFYAERQSLAIMDHPSIAKVFDAGATPDGQPYFVMDYVQGLPITEYCDRRRLTIRERLELFIKVCEGVQHAHQKAVMHRDLKPANILVIEIDGKPVPRIIDFGLAKTASPTLDGETLVTQAGGFVGTPGYISPEQADPAVMDVDTRTDVYSLGAVLYVLLTGSLPFETKHWRKQRFDEFLSWLREKDPPLPSTKISTEQESSKVTSEARSIESRQLISLLQGDLDWITMKALEKDRARRYGTPMELAADISRYLNHEPVIARPASLSYRARKYVRRHKALVAAAAAVFAVLVAGVITSTWEAVKARRAETKAEEESAVAQAVNDFLRNDLLGLASAYKQSKPDPDIKVRAVLDRAAQRIQGKFEKHPEVEAAIRTTIGDTYADLGQFAQAQAQLERALDLDRTTLGKEDPRTLKTAAKLASMVWLQGKYPESEALLSQTADVQRRVLGPEDPDTLWTTSNLANVFADESKYGQAEPIYNQTLEIWRRVKGPESPETLRTMNNLAILYYREGKYGQSEELNNQLLDIRRRVLGPEHPDTLMSMNNLAVVYDDEGKFTQTETLDRQTLEMRRRTLGPEHPDTLRTMNNLANVYHQEGKNAEAEALLTQTIDIQRRVLGPEHPDTLWCMYRLAGVYGDEGKYSQATALYRKGLQARPQDPTPLNALAWFLVAVPDPRQRRPEEALELARRAVKAAPAAAFPYNTLGLAQYRNGLWDDAIVSLNKSAELDHGTKPLDFFFLSMAHWKRGERDQADRFFQQAVDAASKRPSVSLETKMFWAEAAQLLGKPRPRAEASQSSR